MEIPQVILDDPRGIEWYLSRPEHIQKMICEHPPGIYRYNGLLAELHFYTDDGTVGCLIGGIDPSLLIPLTEAEEELNNEADGERLL